jgi:ketosteroid isomerase-like protein
MYMGKLKYIVFVVMFLQLDFAFGQNANLTKLEQQIEAFRLALIDPSSEKLEALVMENLTYGHSSGKIEDKKTFLENLLNGNSNFEEITFFDQKIALEKNTAVVRHQLSAKTNDKGKSPGEVNLHILTVWVKNGKTWKLLARQAVKQQ